MAQAMQPVEQPRPTRPAWVALILTVAGFVLAAIVQVGGYLIFGLCTESDPANCPADTLPTWWQSFLVKGLPYLLWVAPSVLAMVLGVRAARSGNPQGRLVAVVALVVFALTTAAAFAMDWL